MKQRGRKSISKLTAAPAGEVQNIPRAAPPAELSAYETELWVSIVNTKPADWFTNDTLALLRSHVRHCYQASRIDAEMDKVIDRPFSEANVALQFEQLSRMRERETKQIQATARSMRLTQQSQINAITAASKNTREKKRPNGALWES